MLPGKNYSVDEIAQILLNRWWLVALPFVLGTVGGIFCISRLPSNTGRRR